MPRKGKRRTIARGIYQDSGGFEVRATVGGTTYPTRMPPDSTMDELRKKRAELEALGRTETPPVKRGTLRADAARYVRLIGHLESWKDREDHLNRWIERIGDVPRHRITAADVLAARVAWLGDLAPKTINHHVDTLRNLYHVLDGKRAKTPCDDIVPLQVPRTVIQRVSAETMLAVDAQLQKMEQRTGRIRPIGPKWRARFRVYVSCGKRPIEIMRAQPGDVDLRQRVWIPRDAKGGYTPGAYLNEDMLAAWTFFVAVEAWGAFNTGKLARYLRAAGWPATVRPYQARHNTWITASERGVDLPDISVGAGHRDLRMTRRVYVPVLNSRLQRMSEVLDGRFGGWKNVVPESGPADKPLKTKAR